ncbi:hypothetical protein F5H01DRAFT_352327 [Linnemannia elongata]|nr:hypothetical protein F5H01DRAFT_352327 [Linnemannia elongata]
MYGTGRCSVRAYTTLFVFSSPLCHLVAHSSIHSFLDGSEAKTMHTADADRVVIETTETKTTIVTTTTATSAATVTSTTTPS